MISDTVHFFFPLLFGWHTALECCLPPKLDQPPFICCWFSLIFNIWCCSRCCSSCWLFGPKAPPPPKKFHVVHGETIVSSTIPALTSSIVAKTLSHSHLLSHIKTHLGRIVEVLGDPLKLGRGPTNTLAIWGLFPKPIGPPKLGPLADWGKNSLFPTGPLMGFPIWWKICDPMGALGMMVYSTMCITCFYKSIKHAMWMLQL